MSVDRFGREPGQPRGSYHRFCPRPASACTHSSSAPTSSNEPRILQNCTFCSSVLKITMLALAAPLQNHSPHNTAPAKSSSRSKQVSRRPTSSSVAASSSSSSSSGPSSSSNVASSGSVRPSAVAPHFHPGPPIPLKRETPVQSKQSCPPPLYPPQPHQEPPQLQPSSITTHDEALSAEPASTSDAPLDIHAYPSNDLLRLLALLLNQIATANDALSPPSFLQTAADVTPPVSRPDSSLAEHPPIWHTLTTASRSSLASPNSPLTFHARSIPSISLESYLLRILRYCPTTNEVFLSLLVYFDRMSKLAQDATGSRFAIDSYNVHRLVIAGVTVASKCFSDVFYTNSRYAKVSFVKLPFPRTLAAVGSENSELVDKPQSPIFESLARSRISPAATGPCGRFPTVAHLLPIRCSRNG